MSLGVNYKSLHRESCQSRCVCLRPREVWPLMRVAASVRRQVTSWGLHLQPYTLLGPDEDSAYPPDRNVSIPPYCASVFLMSPSSALALTCPVFISEGFCCPAPAWSNPALHPRVLDRIPARRVFKNKSCYCLSSVSVIRFPRKRNKSVYIQDECFYFIIRPTV